MSERVMERVDRTLLDTDESQPDKGFWIVFAIGWVFYGALMATAATVEGNDFEVTLWIVSVNLVPPALFGILLAANRRALFPLDRSLARTVGIHIGLSLVYAGTVGAVVHFLIGGVLSLGIGDPEWQVSPVYHGFNALFLYVILTAFLGWTETRVRAQEARAIVAREAMLRAQAEAKSIRAQFNPHFVFNTLHSLLLLVRADPDAAEQAIEDVAELIRYGSRLQREAVDAVPLNEELEFARRYMALEALRLGDRLTVEWSLDPEGEAFTIPAFCLQTLLENAVKHGVGPRSEPGVIRVRSSIASDAIEIVVEDDGVGADPDLMGDATGQGLHLLRRRFEALYGETGLLEWDTAPGKGFRARLRIPRSPRSEDISTVTG